MLFRKRIERDHAVSIAHKRVRGLGSVFRYGRQRHRAAAHTLGLRLRIRDRFQELGGLLLDSLRQHVETLVNLCPAPRLLPGGMEFPEHGSDTHVSIDHYEL